MKCYNFSIIQYRHDGFKNCSGLITKESIKILYTIHLASPNILQHNLSLILKMIIIILV